MNEKDKAAFERKYGKAEFKSIFELSSYELRKDAYKAALAHRDEQIKGLVEALEKITKVDGGTPVKTYQEMESIAQAALANYKESVK